MRSADKLGNFLFRLFSKWEDCSIFPRTVRWLKLALVGFFVSVMIAQNSDDAEKKSTIRCYIPLDLPETSILESSVVPNPTEGADSVTVKAIGKVLRPDLEEKRITKAHLTLSGDTTRIPLLPLDGVFGDTLEELSTRIYVGDLEPGTTWVYITLITPNGEYEDWDFHGLQFEVTEKDANSDED